MLRIKPQQFNAWDYQANLLLPGSRAVLQMEREGIPVDLDILRSIEFDMSRQAENLLADLNQWVGRELNWGSWQQLAQWLHGKTTDDPPGLELEESPFCKKGEVPDDKVSTDDRALEWLAGHNADHREPLSKLRKMRQCIRMARYARDWLEKALPHSDGTYRLHPTFGMGSDHDNRAGAVTGRFGVKNPPLNQVPRDPKKDPAGMRSAFIAPPGMRLIVVDYSQLEVVILAHIISSLFGTDDPLVQNVVAGRDIHGPAARFIFGELAGDSYVAQSAIPDFKTVPRLKALRDLGKIGIYGKNYGKWINGFAWSTFMEDGEPLGLDRAKLLCEGLDTFYPGVPRYQKFIRGHIERNLSISSLWGRWQPLPNGNHRQQGIRNRAFRQALNYPMQASGQEIMVMALIALVTDPVLTQMGWKLSLVVHDETVSWAPEEVAEEARKRVEYIMVNCVNLLTPLKAEGKTGPSWKDAK